MKGKPVVPKPTVPGAPRALSAAAEQNGTITATWEAPSSDGGSPITGYRLTAQPGNVTVNAASGASEATIPGLNPTETYSVTVNAINMLGTGPATETTGTPAVASSQSGTIALSTSTLEALSSVSATGELVFAGEPGQLANLQAGQVLAAGISAATPDGLLVRVLSVTRSTGQTRVATTPASLDEALQRGGASVVSEPSESEITGFHAARSGVRLVRNSATHALTLSLNSDLYKDGNGRSVTVRGNVSFAPKVSFNAGVRCCLLHTYSRFEGTLTASSSLRLDAQVSHTFKSGFPLATVTFAAIPVDVAGVPLVLVPSLEVKLVASGSANVGISTAASASATIGARVETHDGSVNAAPVHSVKGAFTPPTLDGSLSLKAGVQGTLKVAIDDVVGPYVRDTFYGLELNVNPFVSPWWTLKLENQLAAGINISLLHHTFADWSTGSLLDEILTLAHASTPFEQLTVTPSRPHVAAGGTVQLTATAGGAPTDAVSWSRSARTSTRRWRS